jgi:hypothetical protein
MSDKSGKVDTTGSYYGHNSQGNGYRTEYTSSRGEACPEGQS